MEEGDLLQQQLLSRLNQYGDSLLDEDDYTQKTWKAKAKKKPSSPNNNSDLQTTTTNPQAPSASTKPKNKNTKSKATVSNSGGEVDTARSKRNRRFMNFEEELRQFKEKELEKETQRMGAELKKEGGQMKRPAPEVIIFEDPSRRKKKTSNQTEGKSSPDEFNLKMARHDVRQFGLTGFSFEDREKCEADRAIRLGAWAPKRENINYKEYMVMQKRKKEEERQQREMDRKMGYSVAKKNSSTEKTRVRNQGFWRDPTQDKKFFIDGQVGRYKHGVQVLSTNDITRTRATARSKKGARAGRTNKIKF